uniref:Uncharacterized protein n=1 Tax=viral metagenome TaxID=1070528 RepID=A0A6C0H7X0_9ZZZZ
MSFYFYKSKPELIDLQILDNYNNIIKDKYSTVTIPTKLKEINNYILILLWKIIKNYYNYLIIIILIIVLLYMRYMEVIKKKEKIKNLMRKLKK